MNPKFKQSIKGLFLLNEMLASAIIPPSLAFKPITSFFDSLSLQLGANPIKYFVIKIHSTLDLTYQMCHVTKNIASFIGHFQFPTECKILFRNFLTGSGPV